LPVQHTARRPPPLTRDVLLVATVVVVPILLPRRSNRSEVDSELELPVNVCCAASGLRTSWIKGSEDVLAISPQQRTSALSPMMRALSTAFRSDPPKLTLPCSSRREPNVDEKAELFTTRPAASRSSEV